MKLYRCGGDGNRMLNMDQLIDADYQPAKERLELRFAAPQPASVGSIDWTVEAYDVVLKGSDAEHCWQWLLRHGENLV